MSNCYHCGKKIVRSPLRPLFDAGNLWIMWLLASNVTANSEYWATFLVAMWWITLIGAVMGTAVSVLGGLLYWADPQRFYYGTRP